MHVMAFAQMMLPGEVRERKGKMHGGKEALFIKITQQVEHTLACR